MGAIQITENIRVRRKDKLNVVVEILQTVTNPKTKERRTEWVENGFYRNLRQALQGLRTKDGLIPYEDLKTVEEYLRALKTQDQIIAKVWEENADVV